MHPPLAQAVHVVHRVAGLARSCCKLGPAVSQAWLGHVTGLARPCHRSPLLCRCDHRVAGRVLLAVSHTVSLRRAPCRAPSPPYRGSSPGRVAPISQYNPSAKSRTCHDTPICLATQSPPAVRPSRVRCLPYGKPVVSWLVSAVS